MLRQRILQEANSDIFCLIETHMENNQNLDCENYTVFQHKRTLRHRNAKKASGGVAVLIKEQLLEQYECHVVDKSIDGAIGLQVNNRMTGFVLMLYACYLPPENYVWVMTQIAFIHIFCLNSICIVKLMPWFFVVIIMVE